MVKEGSLLKEYYDIKEKASILLNVLPVIPYNNQDDFNFEKLHESSIKILNKFLSSTRITDKTINEVKQIIDILDLDSIFEFYLTQSEKEFCEEEINYFINKEGDYKISNYELYIENGEFLKQYISYRINQMLMNQEEKVILRK